MKANSGSVMMIRNGVVIAEKKAVKENSLSNTCSFPFLCPHLNDRED